MKQFGFHTEGHEEITVKEGDSYSFGKHNFTFAMAPMVHWPEVMVSFDQTNGVLFSADAFGTFGALDGKLFNDEMDTFTKEKNPAYEFCDTKLFLAYKGDEIVGRIAGLINHAYNKKWEKNAIRFTRFDFIDDYGVSKALFDKVVNLYII